MLRCSSRKQLKEKSCLMTFFYFLDLQRQPGKLYRVMGNVLCLDWVVGTQADTLAESSDCPFPVSRCGCRLLP